MIEPLLNDSPANAVANLRRPPFSIEAEQSVLGAILLDNEALDQVADLVSPDDFHLPAHRVVFRAMLQLLNDGEVVDPVTLKNRLEKNEELEMVGGWRYLAELFSFVPTAAHAAAYGRIVQDKAILRDLAREATAIVEEIYQHPEKVDDILDRAEGRIFNVAERRSQRRAVYHDMRTVVGQVFTRINALFEKSVDVTGVTTGFTDLDKMLAGMQPSDLIIVAGRPSMGKTALAMNFAANAALQAQVPVGVFSLEMSKEQLVMRLLASEARVSFSDLRVGFLKDEDYGKLTNAAGALSDAPIYIDDTPAISVMALRAKARRLKRERGIGLIVVDYLQLVTGSGTSENRVNEISEISRGLKAIAKELHVPVVALSQLSRAVEARTDRRPLLSDLRESGSIEQDADVVMFVYREEYYRKDDESVRGLAEVIVSKHRNGPTGAVPLTFLHAYTRFENRSFRDY